MSAPQPPSGGAAPPTAAGRYGWFVGVLAVLILAYIGINTLRTNGPGSEGPPTGRVLPPFAAPLLLSSLAGDANLAARPHSGRAGAVAACSVRRPDALNSCDLARGGPVVLGFFFTRGAHCTGSFDAMQRLSARTPGVRYAGVVVRGDRGAAAKIVRQHHWTFPVVYDHDGGLANVYGIAGCPEVVLAYPGGVVRGTIVGRDQAERDLSRHVAGLVAASRARGWRPPA
jgi:peroxiredoxin